MRKVRIIVAVVLTAFGLYLDSSWSDTVWARAFCMAAAHFKEAWGLGRPGPGDERAASPDRVQTQG